MKRMSFLFVMYFVVLPPAMASSTNRLRSFCNRALTAIGNLIVLKKENGARGMQSRRLIQTMADIETILIVVAMPVEYDALKKEIPNGKVHQLHAELGIDIFEAKVGSRTVLIGKSGVGTVNGALMTVLADSKFHVDAVLLLGVGGALDNRVEIGDLVVSNHIVQHDSIFSGEVDELMAPGELYLSVAKSDRLSARIPSSKVIHEFLIETVRSAGYRVFSGTVLSGNEFAARTDRKKVIANLDKDALLVDMEGAGIAQVCRKLGIPMVAAKTVADRLEPKISIEGDYKEFLQAASDNARVIFGKILEIFRADL